MRQWSVLRELPEAIVEILVGLRAALRAADRADAPIHAKQRRDEAVAAAPDQLDALALACLQTANQLQSVLDKANSPPAGQAEELLRVRHFVLRAIADAHTEVNRLRSAAEPRSRPTRIHTSDLAGADRA